MRDNKECCPYCKADLQGEPIPKESQKVYGSAHFTRKISTSSIEADRIIKWKCPDYNKERDRD
ncbi:hypothetical protein SHY81_08060 [Bacillus velezensis]|uniref:hypothetical protein n=1 Tax=Bacillus amyloliquefaciens group TaxID=1938374 RepID=UPI0013D5F52F|nr:MULTISPECIES: hypothetical protein [Bacillus amyloliquefaciens group]MBW7977682.1 hypothetical protein [Bacillus velezensis]MCR4365447.1 hypothetical protein [Bacillus amyloliquefaciens]MCV3199858.1 hypothetical protein [Bacillus velezensis]MDP1503668.1 hypothetical protein [Bacillus velezensis]MDP1507193.1 hypothetical protein [Bacillus velezensis]